MAHGKPLVYKPTDFQRHLWKYHKLTDASAEASEREGRNRYEAFGDFSDEVFHRLYAEQEDKLPEPAPGADVFVKLHDEMEKIPEMADFRTKCTGNERWAGIGAAAVIDTLVDKVTPPAEKIEDARDSEEIEEMLRQLIEGANTPEQAEALQELLDEQTDPSNPTGAPVRKAKAAEAASLVDETEVRSAVRAAMKQANEQIEAEEQMVDAFSFGMEQHSGRASRNRAHRELSQVVGNSERLKRIAELAGRMRRIAQEQQRQKPKRGTDEVTGIEQGADLGKLVPSQLLYATDEVEMVFAAKLHERALLQVEMSKTPKKEQGPIVMVIDSSGSMEQGDADIWAAAVGLAFAEIAFTQKRALAFIHFGSTVLRTDVFASWDNIDRSAVLDSVSFFASDGGTNFMDPLDKAVDVIRNTGAFTEADIVMITDGCSAVSDDFLQRWEQSRRELEFKCYSILVGGSTYVDTNEKFSDEVVLLADVLANDESMHKFFKAV